MIFGGIAHAERVSFRQDVEPILTKAGCNAGQCHGKLAGQNGFKLSLRGYAPELDYLWLTNDVGGRRINFAAPGESLMVLKPLGKVPHEGGKKFAEGSREHQTLVRWIAERAPGPMPLDKEKDASRLEIVPASRVMKVGESLKLSVAAHYPDGRAADVTWVSNFYSNDEATVSVASDGTVKALRAGETAVRVHFQGQVAVIMCTMPYENAVEAGAFAEKNNGVDEFVFAKLAALKIPPSGLCDDATFIRRLFLDAMGTLPSSAEVRSFVADRKSDKRGRLIDEVLGRPEFVDYWTLQLCDLLQNRKERDHDVRGAKGVRDFAVWMRGQVEKNRPWNELARDVLTASGDSTKQPQIGYYIVTMGEKSQVEQSELPDSVAQAFLGTRIGCARCHNHPLEKFTQDDYYHFTAFFARLSMKRESSEKGPTVLRASSSEEEAKRRELMEAEKKLGEAQKAAEGKSEDEEKKLAAKVKEESKRVEEVKKQLAAAMGKKPVVMQPRTKIQMTPQTLDRTELELKPGEDPRARLAEWVTGPKNEAFGGNMVNRIWKHYLGVGLVEQVDDLRSSNPPSNAGLWKMLDGEFISHSYDMRHLMRVILNSRTYQLSSKTMAGNETERKFYSHYYARRLPAEVMLDAISAATGVPDTFSGYPVGMKAVQLPEPGVGSYFLTLFGRSDRVTACACERSGDVTLPQLLHLHNGEEVEKKIKAPEGRLAGLMKREDAVEEMFLSTVGRGPSESEKKAVEEAMKAGDTKEDVYRDLMWALLNSKEFGFNH
ncbi:MAG TPA: DUF1549 domain-containing protein [Tepidisphaeraceae bacterium]|jgi:hypothetical protein|nr:DUF1549 domain-containing protein [Tepidisphaeraceae bacterium]